MERTGYKEIWIGATPPTKAHRQSRDRRILVGDIWFDTAEVTFKQCSSVNPPTWDYIEFVVANLILVSANGTKYRVGVENNGAVTTTAV